jgi:hypothetical protein
MINRLHKFAALILCLIPLLAHAAASVRQEAHTAWTAASATTVTTPALGSAALVGDTMEAWVICSCTTAPTSVVDSASQAYTLRTSVNNNDSGATIYLYTYVNNASATALTVTATWGTGRTYNGVWLKDITGVTASSYQTAGGNSQTGPGTGTGAITSGNVTPSAQPCLLSTLSWDSGGNASSTVAGSLVSGTTGWLLSGATAATTTSASLRLTSTSAIAATFSNATDGGTRDFITIAAIYTEASTSVPSRGFFIN